MNLLEVIEERKDYVPISRTSYLFPNSKLEWINPDSKEEFERNTNTYNLNPNLYDHSWATKRADLKWYSDNPITYEINKYGYRGIDIDPSTPCNLFLGCSFTFGIGLHQEHTWVNHLSNYLPESPFNCGVPGTGPNTGYLILNNFLSKLNIKRVFAFYPFTHRYLLQQSTPKGKDILIDQSFIKHVQSLNKKDFTSDIVQGLLSDEYAIIDYQKTIDAIGYTCISNDIEFYLLDTREVPVEQDVLKQFKKLEIQVKYARDILHGTTYQQYCIAQYFKRKLDTSSKGNYERILARIGSTLSDTKRDLRGI